MIRCLMSFYLQYELIISCTNPYKQQPTCLLPPLIQLNGDEDRESIEDNFRGKHYAASKCDFYDFNGDAYINHHR